MNKKEIKVIIKNNHDISEENYTALKSNKKIEYFEKNLKTSLIFEDLTKLRRENEEYVLELEFIPNKESKGFYKSKKDNIVIDLNILTDYVIIEENIIIIKYTVLTTEQDVIFKLEM